MKRRTITGAGITAIVYLTLYYSHLPLVLLLAVCVLNTCAVYELFHAAGVETQRLPLLLTLLGVCCISVCPINRYTTILTILFPITAVLFIGMMAFQKRIVIDSIPKVLVLCMVTAFLFRSISQLRAIPMGLWYLFLAITLCFVTDVGAYLAGRAFGKRKLMPSVSPHKTVEGAVAGILSAILFLFLAGKWMEHTGMCEIHYNLLLLYGALAAVVGEFGDLAMSVVKRICRIKDFSNLLPGHGGILDRFDSQMFCIAFTLIFIHITGGFLSPV